jgi:hypothetical protein
MRSTPTFVCLVSFVFVIFFVSGQDKKPTPQEKEGVEKLRKLAGKVHPEYLNEDFMLLNFLRDSNLDVNAANTKLQKAVEWRKTNKIDTILDEKILPELYPWRVEGEDKLGRPIFYIAPARWDVRKVILAGQRDQVLRIWAQVVESAMQAVLKTRKESGKDINEIISIMDLHGYNLRQHACLQCFTTYFEWTRMYENNYPQVLGAFYMINVPRIFTPLLELLKGIFSPHTQRVLKVFGPNQQQWKDELLKVIDEDNLLQIYGGKRP